MKKYFLFPVSLFLSLILIVMLSGVGFTGTVNLPQTGQTKCYDESGAEISCTGTGQDGDIQAGVAWPEPRFTDNGDSTVTDNLTGLMWTKDANLPGTKRWLEALDYCNNLTLAGYSDWRLPNVNELESLVNANEADGASWLTAQGFISVQPSSYWSSTTDAYNTDSAWYLSIYYGKMDTYWGAKTGGFYYYVWPVRSGQCGSLDNSVICLPKTGQTKCYNTSGTEILCSGTGQDGEIQAGVEWPSPRFTDHGNTVTDNLTGLMWTKNTNLPNDSKSWQEALNYVASLNTKHYLGYTDWRLPNRKELLSLTDYSKYNPPLPSGHPFTNVQAYDYWSSTTYAYYHLDYAWIFSIWDGSVYAYSKSDYDSYYVWPVRGGLDISVNMTDLPDTVTAGSNLTYTILVKNNGPAVATGVTLTDTLPSSVTYVSATTTQGTFSGSGNTVTCSIGTLVSVASATITIIVQPTTAGTVTNTASVTCNETDWNTSNNTATTTTVVTNAYGWFVTLPQTGQMQCYDSLEVISCTSTGQDGEIRAGVEWPSPRFTDNGDETMTDNLTGLIWTKNANLPGDDKTWQQALDYVKAINAGTYPNFDYTDWRLPNVNELESLINANEADSANWLSSQGFANVQAHYYWSSTSYAYYTGSAWVVSMRAGGVYDYDKSNARYVWPVRAGQPGSLEPSVISLPKTGQTKCYDTAGAETPCAGTGQDGEIQAGVGCPSPRFTNNGDDTVTDNLTGLMWTKDANLPNYYIPWQQALDYVAGMNAGTYHNFGYKDWHLPNRKELYSLTDFSRHDPALPANHPFTNVQAEDYCYWSSTSEAYFTSYAWGVSMCSGNMDSYYDNSDLGDWGFVWPVRGGQIQPAGCSTWSDVITKYNSYVSDSATWTDVINCYNEYVL